MVAYSVGMFCAGYGFGLVDLINDLCHSCKPLLPTLARVGCGLPLCGVYKEMGKLSGSAQVWLFWLIRFRSVQHYGRMHFNLGITGLGPVCLRPFIVNTRGIATTQPTNFSVLITACWEYISFAYQHVLITSLQIFQTTLAVLLGKVVLLCLLAGAQHKPFAAFLESTQGCLSRVQPTGVAGFVRAALMVPATLELNRKSSAA